MNLNLTEKDKLILAVIVFIGLVLYMEIQKTRCSCKTREPFLGTVTPTFYRSLSSLPSVDGNVQLEPSNPVATTMANANAGAQMTTSTCLFEGEKCNCCEGMECRGGSCQFPIQA